MKLLKNIACGIGLAALTLAGCTQDFDKINVNPNEPELVPTYSLFYHGTRQLMNDTRDEWFGARIGNIWMQYYGTRNYQDEDRYVYRESVTNDVWKSIYLSLNNLNQIIKIAEHPDYSYDYAEVYGNANNQVQAARVMKAFTFQLTADTFGAVPYESYSGESENFQALGGSMFPKYAPSVEIYADMLEDLKAAAGEIDESKPVFSDYDLIYSGNATYWKKLANSLRLRIAVRVKNVPELADVAMAHINELKSNPAELIAATNEGAFYHFEANDIKGAPMYKSYFVNNRVDFMLSKHFVDVLKGELSKPDGASYNNPFEGIVDPRLYAYATPGNYEERNMLLSDALAQIKAKEVEPGELQDYIGIPVGVSDNLAQQVGQYASLPGQNSLQVDYLEPLMTYAEVAFLLSEVNNFDADYYEKGIRSSMEQWGVPADMANDYINALPTTVDLEAVITQKYLSLFTQSHEAWAEYRRTGFPRTLYLPGEISYIEVAEDGSTIEHPFAPRLAGQDVVPTRMRYPLDEFDLNGANYTQAIEDLGANNMLVPLIWAKK
ncbi:SusD/RagB family nutrient-binding outer membrane lipoprotein [Persicobacter psychrovividus]|uniref:SusD/RagB family nutrient-binding outer membrane lipoprotein n=1 Tax=Persicobacter psychrovividus TaxID=387638 RepID=A0ABN6LD47_9BACT|nr:hypothetical protein PEPS_33850 [Persicobacter psychrovividus]